MKKQDPLEGLSLENQVLVRMKRGQKTDTEIGKRLGVSKHAIFKRRRRLTKKFGETLFISPDKPLFTPEQVAEKLNIPPRKVHELLREKCIRAAVRKGPYYFLDQKGIDLLKQQLHVSRKKVCRVCGEEFLVRAHPRGYGRSVCYHSLCVNEKKRRWVEKSRTRRDGTTLSPQKKYKVLRNLVAKDTHPEKTEWLSRNEAALFANVRLSQLEALAEKGIIHERPHPTRMWQDKPEVTYSRRELSFVKYVYREYV